MAENLDIPTPSRRQLKEFFRPFDTRFNKEKFHINIPDPSMFKPAGLLIPLFYKDGEIHVILTVRTKNMPSHAGLVAFPGGMSEPEDADAVATALREAKEEVGIRSEDVDIVAVLSQNIVGPNSLVTPVVGILYSDFKLHTNPREVDMVFDLPLKRFLSSDRRTQEILKFNQNFVFSVYHFRDTINSRELDTWGISSLLCIQVALVAFQSDMKIGFHNDVIVTKENCFTVETVQAVVDKWKTNAKL